MSPQIRPLEREFRSDPTPGPTAFTAALRDLRSPPQHATIVVVPGGWVADVAPAVRGTGITTSAALTEQGSDLLRMGRRCLAAGADELEVPWSELLVAAQAFGTTVPISTQLPEMRLDEIPVALGHAAERGANLVHVNPRQYDGLVAQASALVDIDIDIGLRSMATDISSRRAALERALADHTLTRLSLPLPRSSIEP